MFITLLRILVCTIISIALEQSLELSKPCLFGFLSILKVTDSEGNKFADYGRRGCTVNSTCMNAIQQLPKDTEGFKCPQEVQSALSRLIHSFTVAVTVIFIFIHHLFFFWN